MDRLFYDSRSGDIITVSGRVIATAETLTQASAMFLGVPFMVCNGREDYARVVRIATYCPIA